MLINLFSLNDYIVKLIQTSFTAVMSKEEGRAQDGNIPDSVSAEKSVAAVGELDREAAAAEIDRLIRASESELDLEDDVDGGGGEEEEEKEEKEEAEEEEEEGEEEEDELADLRFLDAVIVQGMFLHMSVKDSTKPP